MTYRYIFLLLHTANSMFLARRSRSLGSFSGAENRRWLSRTLASTMAKSQHLSEEVYLAMAARGYQGEIFTLNRLQFRNRDYWWLGFTLIVAAVPALEHLSMNELNPKPIFEVRDLGYDYPGGIAALSGISFAIHSGEMVALVGANGSGKSTLLKLLDGLVFPTRGEILALGHPLSEKTLQERTFRAVFSPKGWNGLSGPGCPAVFTHGMG